MEFFDKLAAAIGPIGALFAIAAGYLYLRNQQLTDRIMSAFLADVEQKTQMLNALTNLRETLERIKAP